MLEQQSSFQPQRALVVQQLLPANGLPRNWKYRPQQECNTYIATSEGWLYLCAVRDGCSVLGWSLQAHLRADLVDQALTMAVVLRGTLPDKVIFHADRGTQYTSSQIADLCAGLGLLQSVGLTGVGWDNAPAESFWSTLKTELYNRRRWATKADAKLAVGRWLEERYNRKRRHSAIGMMTPVQFEQHQQTATLAARPRVHQMGSSPQDRQPFNTNLSQVGLTLRPTHYKPNATTLAVLLEPPVSKPGRLRVSCKPGRRRWCADTHRGLVEA
jgi:hypothetical protein